MTMGLLLSSEDGDWLNMAGVDYFIPADWIGEHDIVSHCGWWIGKVCIVQTAEGRYLDWICAYSLKFEGEA